MGELALHFEMVVSFYVCQPNHSYADLVYTVILHVPLWLQVCCTESGQSYPTSICTAFVWHLLCVVTPLSQDISTILTYSSYILFLIHSWYILYQSGTGSCMLCSNIVYTSLFISILESLTNFKPYGIDSDARGTVSYCARVISLIFVLNIEDG